MQRDGGGEDHLLRATGGDHDALTLGKAGTRAAIGGRRVEDALDFHGAATRLEAATDPLQ